MSKEQLPDEASTIEGASPTESTDTFFSKSGTPSEKLLIQSPHTPSSLHAKPWPARPQRLYKGIRGWRWWDSALDGVLVMLPIPFFVLAAAVVAVNGRVVEQGQFSILDHSIKGAS
jgi:hypothetical protein